MVFGAIALALCSSGTTNTTVPAHTVSGFSSGGSLAVAHFLAHSASVSAVGVLGGSPYGCQLLPHAQWACSGKQNGSPAEDTTIPWDLYDRVRYGPYLRARDEAGLIDPLAALRTGPPHRAFLFSGLADTTVFQQVMVAVRAQLANLSVAVRAKFDLETAHAFSVDDATCGRPGIGRVGGCCGYRNGLLATSCAGDVAGVPVVDLRPGGGCCGGCTNGSAVFGGGAWKPPINNCGYDLAGALLNWVVLGAEPGDSSGGGGGGGGGGGSKAAVAGLKPRGVALESNLLPFAQAAHLPADWNASVPAGRDAALAAGFAQLGFAYAPSACRASAAALAACGVHVHYHPCTGNWEYLNTSYMLETGLAAYAESNGIVLLYPQAATARPGDDDPGCWDWYGGIDGKFDTKQGVQIATVVAMVAALPQIVAAGHSLSRPAAATASSSRSGATGGPPAVAAAAAAAAPASGDLAAGGGPVLPVQTWPCAAQPAAAALHQQWAINPHNDSTLRLGTGSDALCVGTSDCNEVVLGTCTGAADQRWDVLDAAGETGAVTTTIKQRSSGFCINAHLGVAAGLPVSMGPCAGTLSAWARNTTVGQPTFTCASVPTLCIDHGSTSERIDD